MPYSFIYKIKLVIHRNYMFLFSSKEYSSYPSFPQSQYSQYYSSSYNSPYMSTNSISPSAIPTSTYSLQESSHNITSQSTESLSGECFSFVFSLQCLPSIDISTVTLLLDVLNVFLVPIFTLRNQIS